MMRVNKQSYLMALLWMSICGLLHAEDSLPALQNGFVPSTVAELWAGYDPRKEPLDVEVIKEWEEEGLLLRSFVTVLASLKVRRR